MPVQVMDDGAAERSSRFAWKQISLRALFLAFTVVAVASGVLAAKIHEAERQEHVLQQIEALGGRPFRLHSYGPYLFVDSDPPFRSKLSRFVLGKHFYTYAPCIWFDGTVTEVQIRAMIPLLAQVRIKEECNGGETYLALFFDKTAGVDANVTSCLERELPNCRVIVQAKN